MASGGVSGVLASAPYLSAAVPPLGALAYLHCIDFRVHLKGIKAASSGGDEAALRWTHDARALKQADDTQWN